VLLLFGFVFRINIKEMKNGWKSKLWRKYLFYISCVRLRFSSPPIVERRRRRQAKEERKNINLI